MPMLRSRSFARPRASIHHPTLNWATTSPCSAAWRYHFTASARFFSTPCHCNNVTEVVQGCGVSLLGRLAQPPHGFLRILGDALAEGIADAEVALGVGIALFGRLAIHLTASAGSLTTPSPLANITPR